MSLREFVKIEVEVEVDVAHLAERFSALSDDAQAQFLCIAARRISECETKRTAPALFNQAWAIGRHLRTCDCSTDDGREFVRQIVAALDDRP